MKEIRDILHAFSHANRAGKKTAIATFVHASGSLRRRLGVRVLITEDGQVFGSDSKGSIEGRAFQKVLGDDLLNIAGGDTGIKSALRVDNHDRAGLAQAKAAGADRLDLFIKAVL